MVTTHIFEEPNLTGGIDTAIISTASSVSVFVPMLLLFVFGVVFIGGITAQKRRIGTADIPMWITMASISTLMIALPMTLTEGLIDIITLSIIVAITIASGFWLFLDRNRNEI